MLQLSVVSSDKEFLTLKQDWQILLANSSANSLFCSWDLALLFWRVYGSDAQLKIVCVHRHNQLIGIFPFYVVRHRLMKLFSVRKLRWLGTGGDTSPDYFGGIVHYRHMEHYQSLLADAVMQLRECWDVCDLRDMHTGVEPRVMREHCLGTLRYVHTSTQEIIVAKLKSNWDEYLAQLSSNRRQQIRRARRRVFEQEGIQLDRLSGEEDLERWFQALVTRHHQRWYEKTESTNAFSSDRYNLFHRQFMRSMLEHNALRLWGLRKDSSLIAVLYFLSDGQSTYYFQGGFDPGYDELKPGMVLLSCAMEEAIKEGCEVFNMMKGDYHFKRSLAKQQQFTHAAILIANTFSGLIYWIRFAVLPKLKHFNPRR